MRFIKTLVLGILFIIGTTIAETKKTVSTHKIDTVPVIDGVIDEAIWKTVLPATDFYRFQPESGGHAPVKTEVRFLYDDIALYVAATMYDPDAANIPTQLGKRDSDDVLADWLGIWISPFNDGTNDLNFGVTSAGVQLDRKFSPNNVDGNWNPVWASDVSLHDQGWSLEMAIPFSQIRFPSKDLQTWGINIARYRANQREVYTWEYLDKAIENFTQQAGLLLGIEDIEPPYRLSFTPYASTSLEHYPFNEPGKSNYSRIIRGGMDVKYGINESFTLDMTLIPDFGQVQSDNIVLNLSPFEVRYDEYRPFFTEGTQLLQKAGLFYTRRVGSTPIRYWEVAGGGILENGEEIIANPDETQLINATKVTGQTVSGISLGLFNAMTAATYATIADSLGNEREYLTNPFTNYNLVVIGKNLKNGSDFTIANSNVQRFSGSDSTNDFRDANVTGFETRLLTKNSQWVLEASGAYDQLSYPDSVSTGFKFNVGIAEQLGAFQYGLGQNIESEYFDPNDMGFLRQSNDFSQYAWLALATLNPVWKLNNARINVRTSYSSRFHPRLYTSFDVNVNYNMTFRNYVSVGGGFSLKPKDGHDYNEPRVEGLYFTTPKWFDIHTWVSSNFNKPFSMSGWMGGSATSRRGSYWRGTGMNPRWRVNKQWVVSYNLEVNSITNGYGFADYDNAGNPVFGERDQVTITNSFNSQYIFSRNLESDIRMRYYRSALDYDEFFDLGSDGELYPSTYTNDLNTVFGAFTVDAVMIWRFAPGSELNITLKNAIYTSGDDPGVNFFDDVRALGSQDQSNSISLKLLYYVDSWALKHRLQ